MKILIDHREAKLKSGTSFQFIAENRSFTGSDSYTLAMEFPLAGCAENTAIFGHLHRTDVEVGKVVFDCEIIDRAFYKAGVATVTELSETMVKTQFLEGRSVQNYEDTFDDIYINELDLGELPATAKDNAAPEDCWRVERPEEDCVALPWVNDDTGNIQNEVAYDGTTGKYAWVKAEGTSSLGNVAWQVYLVRVARSVFEAMGYTVDFAAWESSPYRYLLVCNTLPAAWNRRQIAYVLPRWSVTEFIGQLELLLNAELDVDHKARHVAFAFAEDTLSGIAPVKLEKVADAFTAEVSQKSETEYASEQNLAYADAGHALSLYYDCEWYIRKYGGKALAYDTLAELTEKAKTLQTAGVRQSGTRTSYSRGYASTSDGNKLFYAKDVDTYFIMKCYKATLATTDPFGNSWYEYHFALCPVNVFGKLIVDEESEDEAEELGMLPVCIDDTSDELGQCMFLSPASFSSVSITVDGETGETTTSGGRTFGSSSASAGSSSLTLDSDYYNAGGLAYSGAGYTIKRGEEEKSGEYYSHIFLGFWDGVNRCKGYLPRPVIDRVAVNRDFSFFLTDYSLRINERAAGGTAGVRRIVSRRKYNFSFLADDIPTPRAVFHIKGRRFLCEKLTATFTERGMSQLIKGVFYLVDDA